MVIPAIKIAIYIVSSMTHWSAGEILKDATFSAIGKVLNTIWFALVPLACGFGAAFLILGLRNLMNYMDRRKYDLDMQREADLYGGLPVSYAPVPLPEYEPPPNPDYEGISALGFQVPPQGLNTPMHPGFMKPTPETDGFHTPTVPSAQASSRAEPDPETYVDPSLDQRQVIQAYTGPLPSGPPPGMSPDDRQYLPPYEGALPFGQVVAEAEQVAETVAVAGFGATASTTSDSSTGSSTESGG
jgi:hypothetical protein